MKRLTLLAVFALLCSLGTAGAQDLITPAVAWTTPGSLRSPAALTATQLNASANVPGTFVYDPALGTVLSVGDHQTLSVTFTPTDTATYTGATATVFIDVIDEYAPYGPIEQAIVCHVDSSLIPIVDSGTSLPRCFVVPVAVNQAVAKFMISQTNGLDPQGRVAYKYTNWWDMIVKHFVTTLVNPMLDQFPPADLAAAKAKAAAAASAVDAAKAAILTGHQ